MHQVAVVCAPSQWPPQWKLEGFELHHHTGGTDLAQRAVGFVPALQQTLTQ